MPHGPRPEWLVFTLVLSATAASPFGCASQDAGGNPGSAGTSGGAGTTGAAGSVGSAGTTGAAGRGGTTGAAGTAGPAGSSGGAGRGGTTGLAGTTGATGTGGITGAALCQWPTATGSMAVSATIPVGIGAVYDGGMKRFTGAGALGTSGQGEDQDPMFNLQNGATLQNIILGAPAADGVHCNGTCTLRNVWWEDVGEDAATLDIGTPTQVMTIDGGGAKKAADKIFQHNGGGTMVVQNFCAQDFGKLYRSCGNCADQFQRRAVFRNIMAVPSSGTDSLAGINTNYNDSATFSAITIKGTTNSIDVCKRYTGNDTGAEPMSTGTGADGKFCIYSAADITWMP